MPESVVDQIVVRLRAGDGAAAYPNRAELKNVRVVGHTPKTDHYIYDIVLDFTDGNERLAAKVYRPGKGSGPKPKDLAKEELKNLQHAHGIFAKKKMTGIPRPVGDFSELGAVVAEKFTGVPLQSIIMKAALLPGYADRGTLAIAARKTGEWLRNFHKATADMPAPFDSDQLLKELADVCKNCRGEGLDEAAIKTILNGAEQTLARAKKTLPTSAVLNDFSPLNVLLGEQGIGVCEFGKMDVRSTSLQDVANFLACVEALEKYPFCNRGMTAHVQEEFQKAYGINAQEEAILRVMKMKTLLAMFARGRGHKETAVRKKVMWATVMKRFIHQAARRSLAPAA
jgi:hypothetical protein